MNFKVGDKVEYRESCPSCYCRKGDVKRLSKDSDGDLCVRDVYGFADCWRDDLWKLVSGKEVSMKDCKWGVKYERDEDPVEFFKTRKLAEERVVELLDDGEVDKSEIYVFEVGETFKVDRPVNFKLIKV